MDLKQIINVLEKEVKQKNGSKETKDVFDTFLDNAKSIAQSFEQQTKKAETHKQQESTQRPVTLGDVAEHFNTTVEDVLSKLNEAYTETEQEDTQAQEQTPSENRSVRSLILDFTHDTIRNQARLDEYIREQKGISDDEWLGDKFFVFHELAYKNEVSEFINECHDVWKYWKSKPVNTNRIVDEFVDVVHFANLIVNKVSVDGYHILETDELRDIVYSLWREAKNNKIAPHVFLHTLEKPNFDTVKSTLRPIVHGIRFLYEQYGIGIEDVIDAYHKKNKENYERQQNGY